MKYFVVFLLFVFVIGLAGILGWYTYSCKYAEPEWFTETAKRGNIRKLVSASGSLAALNTVQVGCQVSGIIATISVDFNDEVERGQLLAEIDATSFQAELLQAQAILDGSIAAEKNLETRLQTLQANLLSTKAENDVHVANIQKANIQLESERRNFTRIKAIYQKKLVPQADVDNAKSGVDLARASLAAAKSQQLSATFRLDSCQSQILGLHAEREAAAAGIRQRRAQLAIAKANLSRTRIVSPISGVIISRQISVGQTVAASFQAPTLFTIAQDLRQMQIETKVDESDVCHVKPGQIATFTVDPYPTKNFSGIVKQVRLSPSTDGVVMYPVIISVENPQLLLKPGLTAKVEIEVEHRKDVVRIPTSGMFFTPPPEILQRYPQPDYQESDVATETMTIWIVGKNKRLEPIKLVPGLSNARFTEVIEGSVASGATVVLMKKEWWMGWVGRR